jgi:MoaA/NifB/PqqE/SkfB family radical SAM enzyme
MNIETLAAKFSSSGNYRKAIPLLLKILETGNNNNVVQLELGKAYFFTKDYANAKKYLRKISSKNSPQKSEALYYLLKIFKQEKDYSNAAKTASLLKGDSLEILFELASFYLMTDNKQKALNFFEKIIKLYNDSDAKFETAKTLENLDNFDKAADYYKKCIENGCRTNESYEGLFRIYNSLSGYAELKKYFHFFAGDKTREKTWTDNNIEWLKKLYKKADKTDFRRLFSKLYNTLLSPKNKNRVLSFTELIEKKLTLKSKPNTILVQLTGNCNLRCIMCHNHGSGWSLPKGRQKELIDYLQYASHVSWLGGEPLTYPDIEYLMDAAYKAGVRQQIVTNGLLINNKIARKIAKYNINVIISIDSAVKKIYEAIRVGADFNVLRQKLTQLKEARKKYKSTAELAINAVIMNNNYKHMHKLIDFGCEFGFNKIVFKPPISGMDDYYDIGAKTFFKGLHKKLETYAQVKGIEIESWIMQMHESVNEIKKQNNTGKNTMRQCATVGVTGNLFCSLPWQRLTILFDGSVQPECCCTTSQKLGKKTITSIWNGKLFQIYRKNMLSGKHKEFCSKSCNTMLVPESFRFEVY